MSSRSVVLAGRQAPRLAVEPLADWSHADDAAFLASSYGLTPDEWQFGVLESWLGARRNGRWSATTCGLAVPRQNGKNGLLEVRELYGMVALGEKFLHTAHEVKTARKAFLRLAGFFENERKYPELAALATEIRRTNGQEAIVLENGGSVEFVARSKGSGRGFTVDVLVLDEAQQLSDEALAALKPTISAAPTQNPQTIFTGTPPAPNMNGEVWTRTRQAAVGRSMQRLAWHEWSLVGEVDLDDRELWAATNPSLGTRLNVEVLEDERAAFSDDDFARERLGMWDETANAGGALDLARWREQSNPAVQVEFERVAYAVETDGSQAWASLGAARLLPDGKAHLEVDRDRGTRWVIPRCVELSKKHQTVFVVDGGSAARHLIDDMEQAGLNVITADTKAVGDAYARFVDALNERQLIHGPQPELEDAVRAAKSRPCGDGGLAFGRRVSGADIGPLVAVSLAHWALVTQGPVSVLNSIW